jgi:hypothetical protein
MCRSTTVIGVEQRKRLIKLYKSFFNRLITFFTDGILVPKEEAITRDAVSQALVEGRLDVTIHYKVTNATAVTH